MKSITDIFTALLLPADGYRAVAGLFLRLIGVIYFIAFVSLSVQVIGLVGADGILPFAELLDYVYETNGAVAYLRMPHVFWLNSSDTALQAVTVAGSALSLLLVAGYRRAWLRIVLFLLYLSLFYAGQSFLTFQWDSLLLETGFLAIFLDRRPSALLLFLFHWLLFRVRFMSGVAKLASGDPVWANLTTLNYYFETQPLPHWGAWYFHQLPEWLLFAGTVFVFFTELIVPLFIFMGRRMRHAAALITLVMQLLIIATSNHNWINLLTILLCLFLLDDRSLRSLLPARLCDALAGEHGPAAAGGIPWRNRLLPVFALLVVVSSASAFIDKFTPVRMPDSLNTASGYIRAWGIGHIFHLFPSMQTERHELQIEGSNDGEHWQAYGFRYKPGALDQRPRFIVPHQPRLDWLMWFVPPRHPEMMIWFDRFMLQLSAGSGDVLGLLAHNPFPEAPPEYLRVQVFRYQFTDSDERARTGNWWKRTYLGRFPFVEPRFP